MSLYLLRTTRKLLNLKQLKRKQMLLRKIEDAQSNEKEKVEDTGDSFTFEPFTLSMTTDENIEMGKPFAVEASLKNTYNGPVTLTEGSKCTEEITFSFTPFNEYAEGQPAPECKDSTKDHVLKVGDSISTEAELTADEEGKYILTAYFANMPLVKKVISVGTTELDKKSASNNLGTLFLDVTAEGNFKIGETIYLTGTLSNKGENFIRMKENSCKQDIEISAKVDNEKIQLPGNYGPCEDDGRSFNLQSGDSINAFSSFTPEKAGTYSITVRHVNDVATVLEFDVE